MGRTDSERTIITFTTAEALNVSNIWNLWLPKYIPANVYERLNDSEVAKFRLKLLFAIVAPIPRAVQYVVGEAQKYLQTPRDSDILEVIDSKALESFYSKSYDELERKYNSIERCTVLPKHICAILLEEKICIDDDISEMIKNSFLVNSLKNIAKNTRIVPKTSVFSVKLFSKDKEEKYWRSIRLAIEKLEELFSEEPNQVKLGQFLESAVRGLINARLYVLMRLSAEAKSQNTGIVTVTISQLLLLDVNNINGASEELYTRLSEDINVPPIKLFLSKLVLPDSYVSMKRFLSDANMPPSISGEIFELFPVPDKECFDYGLLFSSGIDGKPFAIFMDAKSGRQFLSENTVTRITSEANLSESVDVNTAPLLHKISDLPKNGKQALHLLQIASEAKKLDPASVRKGSLVEALREDNYLYIYVNTTQSAPSFAVDDHVMQVGEADSKRLLSFLLDSYRLVRSASTLAQALDAKERNAKRSE